MSLSDDQDRRQYVDEALVQHEHVDVLASHRTEVQDHHNDECIADDSDRADDVIGDRHDSIRVPQVLAQRTVASR